MPAVAMTDHGNLFGAVQFYNAAKAKGVHPVIGCEVYVSQQGHKTRSDTDRYNHLVLLCENQEGYRNLINLVSTAYLEGFYYKPRIDKDLLAQHSKGLIACRPACAATSTKPSSGRQVRRRRRLAYTYATSSAKQFLPRNSGPHLEQDKRLTPQVNRLSQETGIPLVATNDSHYLRRDDARAHEILLCIQTGKTMSDPNRMRLEHAGFLSEIARRDDGAVRRTGRRARPHLGDRAALPRQARKGQGAVPEIRRSRRALHRHLFRIRRAAGIRKRRPRLEAMRAKGA
jgi:DNA polymerase III subunit alpha